MKRHISAILLLLFFVPNTLAQEIPNNDLESWISESDYEIPEGWETSNEASASVTLTVEKTEDAYSGTYAARLESASIVGFVSPAFITTARFEFDMWTQSAELFGGTYFPYRPEKISGHYKYTPATAEDHAVVGVFLLKYNGGEIPDTIGIAEFYGEDTVSDYTYFETTFEYSSSETPDSMQITVLSTDFNNPVAGSVMYIDDMALQMPTGHKIEVMNENHFSIYPNPSTGIVNIAASAGDQITVYDMTGKTVYKAIAEPDISRLNLSELPKSAYIINIKGEGYEESQLLRIQ
ncbi:MAG: T9SS type A sorting domain-containing protein [Bacteroidales bacterium]